MLLFSHPAFLTLCILVATPHQASLSLQTPKVCPSSCPLHRWHHPATSSSDALFSFCSQSFPASGTFQGVICSHQMTKILELQHQSFQWIFRIDLLTAQGTFRGIYQNHGLKAYILWHSPFFTVHLSQPYMTTGKNIASTIWTFVSIISAFQHPVYISHHFPAEK